MRIVVVSDSHLDWRTAGVERFDEVRESFEEAVSFAIDEGPQADLFVFCGDLCDSDDGRDVLRASAYAVDVAVRLMNEGIASLWIAGNHDIVGDGETTTLSPLVGLENVVTADREPSIFVASKGPRRDLFQPLGMLKPVMLVSLPYSPNPYDAGEYLRNDLAAGPVGMPRLIFSHLMLPGMHPGSESGELARGKDRMFPIDVMKQVKPALVVNGHYHRAQTTPDGIRIPGSLARLTFGEEDHEPGFLVIDDDDLLAAKKGGT